MKSFDDGNGVATSSAPRVTMHFDHPDKAYRPTETVTVQYVIDGIGASDLRAVERSVLWYTEGKGEEDLGVHHFERLDNAARLAEVTPSGTIAACLPASPLSYEGVIVKIRWCVRVRLFFTAGRDFVSEHVFEVGAVPPVRGVVERLA